MSAKCYWIAQNFEGNKSMTTYPEFMIAKKSVIHSKQLKKNMLGYLCTDTICSEMRKL